MNIADDFCHHQPTAMMIQETHMQGHGPHQLESSSGEKLHLYFFVHKNRSIAGTGIIDQTEISPSQKSPKEPA